MTALLRATRFAIAVIFIVIATTAAVLYAFRGNEDLDQKFKRYSRKSTSTEDFGELRDSYDVIVVGLGTAGTIVVANLVERFPNISILVLEAGPRLTAEIGGDFRPPYVEAVNGTDTYFDIPAEYSQLSFYGLGKSFMDKEVPFTSQGIGWGGNSEFNGMWVQVPALEHFSKHWPKSWNPKIVEKYFEKITKRTSVCDDPSGGTKGEELEGAVDLSAKIFEEMGAKYRPAFRIPDLEDDGFSVPSVTARNGRRAAPVSDWLIPALNKPQTKSLTIISLARVERLIFSKGEDGLRVTGVEYWKRGEIEDLKPERVGNLQVANLKSNGRVILSAGALKSPKILYMSGIVESAEAYKQIFKSIQKRQRPPLIHTVKGLGRVFDHVGCSIVVRDMSQKFRSFHVGEYSDNSASIDDYLRNRSGPYSVYGPIQSLRMKINETHSPRAEVEAFVIPNGIGKVYSAYSGMNDFSFIFQLLNTTTRNRIILDKNEFLQFQLISKKKEPLHDDLKLAKGVYKLLQTLKRFPDLKVILGPGGISHPDLDPSNITNVEEYVKGLRNPLPGYIYFTNLLINHFGGSIPLGSAVDEHSLKLKGTTNLHVVDGSIIAEPLGAHPIFTIMMVAERASDLIGDQIQDDKVVQLHENENENLSTDTFIL
jgi:cellobiose dehydrogenase (acceptor)